MGETCWSMHLVYELFVIWSNIVMYVTPTQIYIMELWHSYFLFLIL